MEKIKERKWKGKKNKERRIELLPT